MGAGGVEFDYLINRAIPGLTKNFRLRLIDGLIKEYFLNISTSTPPMPEDVIRLFPNSL